MGRMKPVAPSSRAIRALMSSAAPLPTRMFCWWTAKFLAASRAFTRIPEGYWVSRGVKLA